MWQWFKCLLGKHVKDDDTVIMEMGAVYHAGLCRACCQPWVGPFICNAWDESQTEVSGHVVHLKGVNPLLKDKKYTWLGSEESLHELSRLARKKKQGAV